MNLLASLTFHAQRQPDTVAMSCLHRTTSYRKLRSRVERATARLQSEWGVAAGDVVAYCGPGHQDTVVLFLALLQCDASLLRIVDSPDQTLLKEQGVRLLLDGANEMATTTLTDVRVEPLHAIIATRSPHLVRPAELPSAACRMLVAPCSEEDEVATLAVLRETSAADLAATARLHAHARTAGVNGAQLFDEAVFAPVVLAALVGGGSLHIR